MATKVHMEALSPTMEEGQLVRWLKDEGEEVANGDVLAEIETDKATMELVARGAGVLRKRFLQEGDTAEVGAVIGVIAEGEEDISDIEAEAGGGAAAAPAEGEGEQEPETEVDAEAGAAEGAEDRAEPEAETQAPAAAAAPSDAEQRRETPSPEAATATTETGGETAARTTDGRIKASPLARRLAEDAGLALDAVRGSGPGGRITKSDIEAALERGEAAPSYQEPSYEAAVEGPEVEEVPVSQMRKTIAKRLVTSIGPVPTFYLTVDVDMGQLVEARERINGRLERDGVKVSLNDLIVKMTALALRRHPEVNASWQDDVIKRYRRVHMGIAVAVDEGLITPVVRDAASKTVVQIGREIREMAGRAREKKLKPEEYTGATFSLSNLGMYGIEEFTAIINPPEAGILAVGKVEERVVVEEGAPAVRPRMKMTMSCDHRVIDGAMGARFLQTLQSYLEEPVMSLV